MKTPKKWWMCLNPYPEARPPTVRHDSFGQAQAEARRLAINLGRKIHVLEIVGTMHPPSVEPHWEDREK